MPSLCAFRKSGVDFDKIDRSAVAICDNTVTERRTRHERSYSSTSSVDSIPVLLAFWIAMLRIKSCCGWIIAAVALINHN
jgi:hypothetical protein